MKSKSKPSSNGSPMDLTANPRNPRSISTERLETLRQSLVRFGDLGSIILNVETGFLVGGHQRVEAFKSCEDPKVTITERLKDRDATGTVAFGHVTVNGTRYGYREVKWDGATEAAAMIAANNPAGDWVNSELGALLRELKDSPDIKLTGFDDAELARLMKEVEAPSEFNQFDENLPVQHKCPKCGYEWSGKPS